MQYKVKLRKAVAKHLLLLPLTIVGQNGGKWEIFGGSADLIAGFKRC